MKAIVNTVKQSIARKELTVLCGAGISLNSGLPLANPLRNALLDSLEPDPVDYENIVKSGFPFEGYMEAVLDNFDPTHIFSIFTKGQPNANHLFLAALAKAGFLSEIYTTNFDLLIERAFQKAHLQRDTDFVVHYDDTHFENFMGLNVPSQQIQLYKLHGTVDHPQGMKTTLSKVCASFGAHQRVNAVRRLFLEGEKKTVLVLGYSFSDVFDINPQILSMCEIDKDIIVVDYAEESSIVHGRDLPQNHVLHNTNAVVLRCRTDDFVQELWSGCSDLIGRPAPVMKDSPSWLPCVQNWRKQMEERDAYLKRFIFSTLMIRVGHFRRAVMYLRSLWEELESIKVPHVVGEVCVNLSHSLSQAGQYVEAVKFAEEGMVRCKSNEYLLSKCHINAGHAHYSLGEYELAKKEYEKALDLNRKIKDVSELAYCRTSLGNVAVRQKDCEKAESQLQRALRLHRLCGDKMGEAGALHGLGNLRFYQHQDHKALECFKMELEIVKMVDNKHSLAQCQINLSNTFARIGECAKAVTCIDEAAGIAFALNDPELMVLVKAGKANLKVKLGDRKAAMAKFNEALAFAQEHGQTRLAMEIEESIVALYSNRGRVIR